MRLFFLNLFAFKKSIFILSFILCYSYNATALNYYWVGNGGNWSGLSHWATSSGGTTLHTQLPTAADNVFFDVNSFSLPGQVVNINLSDNFAHHINWTGALNNPSWSGASSNMLKIYGSLTLIPGMVMDFSGKMQFLSTTTGQTIATAGKSFIGVEFNGVGGDWTLQDALNCVGLSLVAGTLNTNDKTVTCVAVNIGNSAGASVKTLNMGASIFNLSGNSPWNVTNGGLTVNCGTSVINCSGNNAQFTGGNDISINTYYDLNFTNAAGAGTTSWKSNFHDVDFAGKGTINTQSNFHNLTFHADGVLGLFTSYITINDLNFTAGHNYQVGALKVNGNFHADGTCASLIKIRPVGSANGGYITFANPVHVSFVDMRSIVASGTGPFTVSHSFPYCCSGAGISGWTYVNTPESMYWIGDGGNWTDPNHWSYTSGGPSAGCTPLHDTNVFFDANSFSIPGQNVSVAGDLCYCKNMDWTGVTNMPTLKLPVYTGVQIYGSVKLVAGMDINSVGGFFLFDATTAGNTITTSGQVLNMVMFRGETGEWTLQDTFTSDSIIFFTGGTINTNNQTVNATKFTFFGFYTPRTLNMGSSVFNLSGKYDAWHMDNSGNHVNCGTSVINLTNDTASFISSSFVSNNPFTFYDVNFTGNVGYIVGPFNFHNVVFNGKGSLFTNGGTHTLNDLSFYKDGEIGGVNNFHNLDFTAGHSYKFESGKTQTIANRWKLPGTCTQNISLQTTIPGAFAGISKAADSVYGNYLKVSDIHTSGAAAFMAYHSVDQGGNAGWNFTTAPPLVDPGPISGPSAVCAGATGIIFHVAPVPAGLTAYTWTVPAGATIVSGQGDTLIIVDFGSSSSGNIQVQTFDGCNLSTTSSSLPVTVLPPLTPAVTIAADPGIFVCPATLVSFTASASGTGSAAITYDFKINGTTVQSSNMPVFTSAIANGDKVSCMITVNGGPCNTSTTAISNEITMNTGPGAQTVHVNAGSDISISAGQTVQLNADSDVGTYLWSPATGLSSVNILNPRATPLITTEYILTVTTAAGCTASDNILVEVKAPVASCAIEPRNAFSPNGDGINDKWIVYSGTCGNYPAVSVFNRYGSVVYQSQYYQNDWEGTYKGKPLPVGTYYAVVSYTVNGMPLQKKTAVSIIR